MQSETLLRILETYGHQQRHLIEVLQDIQQQQGYLSEQVIRTVSQAMEVPLIEVYRVASFYKAFSLAPLGRHCVTVCMGTACHVRGAARLLDELHGELGLGPGQTSPDGMFSLQRVNCLGACALGPIVVMNNRYHRHMTPLKLQRLLLSVRKTDRDSADE